MCLKCFLKNARKSNNYQFYLPDFFKFCENSGMVHFVEINQAPSPYSMFQYIGRVATPKLVPRNCLRYLQTTLIMEGGGVVSEFM